MWEATDVTLSANQTKYIYFDSTNVLSVSDAKPDKYHNIILGRVNTNSTTIEFIDDSRNDANYTGNRLSEMLKEVFGAMFFYGCIVSENSTAYKINVTAGEYYFGICEFEPSGSPVNPLAFNAYYRNATSGWNIIDNIDTIPSDKMDDGSGTLANMTNGYYAKGLLLLSGDGSNEKWFYVYPQAEYSLHSEAQAAPLPVVPSFFTDSVVRVASIITKESHANIYEIISERPLPSLQKSTSAPVSDHLALQNLTTGNAGHTQFMLLDGSTPMVGDLNMGTRNLFNVGNINNINIVSHAGRHAPNGLDPLSTASPTTNLGGDSTNSEGTQNTFSRSDHSHAINIASSTVTGLLKNTDWEAFNSKLDGIFAIDINRCGFLNQTETTISFDGVNQFTLAPTGTTWTYYRGGIRHTIIGSKTITLPGVPVTQGKYYIFIDSTDGTLSYSTSKWTLLDLKVPVATIPFNDALTPKYQKGEERHTVLVDRRTHAKGHYTEGTYSIISPILSGYTVDTNLDIANTFAISDSAILDEDVIMDIPLLTDGDGINNNYVIAYQQDGIWIWANSVMPFKYTGSGYIEYNNSGVMTTSSSSKWVNTYLVLTNLDGAARHIFITGKEYASASLAYAETFESLDLNGIFFEEGIAVYQITWSTYSTNTTKGKVRMCRAPKLINSPILSTNGVSDVDNTLANYTLVKSLSDLPAPVGGIIKLVDNTTYQINGTVNIGSNQIERGISNTVQGFDKSSDILIFTGSSGSMFIDGATGGDQDFSMSTLTLSAPTAGGSVFNMSGTTWNIEIKECIFANCASLGSITVGNICNFRQNLITNCSGGISFVSGSATSTLTIADTISKNNTSTIIVFATTATSFGSIFISRNTINVSVGQTAISINASTAVSTGKIDTNNFTGSGSYLTGINLETANWTFSNNVGIANKIYQLYFDTFNMRPTAVTVPTAAACTVAIYSSITGQNVLSYAGNANQNANLEFRIPRGYVSTGRFKIAYMPQSTTGNNFIISPIATIKALGDTMNIITETLSSQTLPAGTINVRQESGWFTFATTLLPDHSVALRITRSATAAGDNYNNPIYIFGLLFECYAK